MRRVDLVRPRLLTFDFFGTVVDWRRGFEEAARAHGRTMSDEEFERLIDLQGALEQGPFRRYADIVADSLIEVLGLDPEAARDIGENVGRFPLYPDSKAAMRRLMAIAPCAATTNSDLSHRAQIEAALGYSMSGWVAAEEVGRYKPAREVWDFAKARFGVEPGPAWWHVSAYADYDLETAAALGLTCVFVERPHCRRGPAHLSVKSIAELADRS